MPQYYLLKGFPVADLICAFSSRLAQNMSLNYADTANSLEHRRIFLRGLGIAHGDLVCTKQVHGSEVRYVQEKDKGRGALSYDDAIDGTDALVTDIANLPLAIFSADCLPVFLYDPKTPALGLAHAGWQGTRDNIVSKTIQFMEKKFNTQEENLLVGFGPSIRSCCYEVKEEFKKFFPLDLIVRNNRYYLDLANMNKSELLALGVKETNIFDTHLCTFCQNEEFFSYRKEGKRSGRMMSVAMLK